MLLRVHFGSKAQLLHFCCFPIIFSIIQESFIQILFFHFLLIKRGMIFHVLPRICKIITNFDFILSNVVVTFAYHEFFTLTLNGLKPIVENQVSNYH